MPITSARVESKTAVRFGGRSNWLSRHQMTIAGHLTVVGPRLVTKGLLRIAPVESTMAVVGFVAVGEGVNRGCPERKYLDEVRVDEPSGRAVLARTHYSPRRGLTPNHSSR